MTVGVGEWLEYLNKKIYSRSSYCIFSDIMSAFTCITCRVVFVDGETQRAHYKTDWHRYNLKRKVAQLPSVTAENFRQRVLNAQETPVST